MPHFSLYAADTPDRPAYIMAGSGQVVTYSELDRISNQIAHLLRASGVQRGDHIAMMMKNCPEFLQVAQAANRAEGLDVGEADGRAAAGACRLREERVHEIGRGEARSHLVERGPLRRRA